MIVTGESHTKNSASEVWTQGKVTTRDNVWKVGFRQLRVPVSEPIHSKFRGRFPKLSDRISKMVFTCNICGCTATARWSDLGRETNSCFTCSSTVRMRGMIHALSIGLFGRSMSLSDFPNNKNLVGAGMSDWDRYAATLADKFSYTNTFYHQEPRLDITDISGHPCESYDFLLSTDVFEHVAPPVSLAFDNVYKLLKPGGVFVFSVPYTLLGRTVEHFPNLHEYTISKVGDEYELHNRTRDGRSERFRNLVFHGGPGTTLEMRVFSLPDLLRHLESSGFKDVKVMDEDFLQFGIHWPHAWSLPILARKR